jgi:hypothetical protein
MPLEGLAIAHGPLRHYRLRLNATLVESVSPIAVRIVGNVAVQGGFLLSLSTKVMTAENGLGW